MMLADLLKRHAADRPRQAALVEGDWVITWSDLDRRVCQLANGLWKTGVRKGDPVAVVLPNGCAFVTTFLALARIGAVVVPVNPEFKALEIRSALQAARCETGVFDSALVELCNTLLNESVIQNAWVEGKGQAGIPGVDGLMSEALGGRALPNPDAECPLIQMLTSGTTGQRKRILRTHGQIMSLAQAYQNAIDGSAQDRILAVIPLSHGHGFCSLLLNTLQSGATLFLQRSFDRRKTMEMLSRNRISIFSAVPFVFSVLADTRMATPMDLSALRLNVTGGAPLRRETWMKVRDRLGIVLRQSYGSVETGALTINMDPNPEATAESVGRSLPGVRLNILDEAGDPQPSGVIGEVAVQSPGAGEPCHADDQHAFKHVDGWIRVNDLGWLDDEGRLYISGRKGSIINVAGQKVQPSEVEAVLCRHPAVKQVAVLRQRDAYGEEAVSAQVVVGVKCTVPELVAYCREQLADYKDLRFFEFRDSMSAKVGTVSDGRHP